MNGTAMQVSGNSRLVGVAALVATVALFTTFVVSARAGGRTSLGPLDLTALRFTLAAALLMPVFLKHRLMGLTLLQAVQLAVFGGGGFALTAYSGIQLAPAGHGSALIHGTLPVMTLVLQAAIYKVRPRAGQMFAIALICCGALLLVLDALTQASGRELLGECLLLCASMLWAAYGIAAAKFRVAPLPGAALVAVVSCALYMPFYLASGVGSLGNARLHDILVQAFIQGVLVSVVGNVVYIRAVASLGPSLTAAGLAITPGAAVVAAWVLLGDRPGAIAICGVLVVMIGVLCAALVSHRLARNAVS